MESLGMPKNPAPIKKITRARKRKKVNLIKKKAPTQKKNPPKPTRKRAFNLLEALSRSLIPQSGLDFDGQVHIQGGIRCRSKASPSHLCFVELIAYETGEFVYQIIFDLERTVLENDNFFAGYEEFLQIMCRNRRVLSERACLLADANRIARNIMRVFNEYLIMRAEAKRKAQKARKKAKRWLDGLSGTEDSPHVSF